MREARYAFTAMLLMAACRTRDASPPAADSPRADAVLDSAAARANREPAAPAAPAEQTSRADSSRSDETPADTSRTARFTGDTTAKRGGPAPTGPNSLLRAVRTARHPGFDRVVFELSGTAIPRWEVGYSRGVAQCGSGEAVRLAGDAALVVRFHGVDAHYFEGEQAHVTVPDRDRHPALGAVKQLVQICDFEATVEWALGIDRRRAFRVSSLTAPPRVVVDVEAGR